MKVLEKRILRGPNVWSPRPCFLAVLDLEDLDDKPSSAFPGFTDKLVKLLPGLDDHRCSTGRRGGFVERLHEGTYMAHITEHVLIELQNMVGIDVGFGNATMRADRGLRWAVSRWIAPPLPAASRPSKTRTMRSPCARVQFSSFTSSICNARRSRS